MAEEFDREYALELLGGDKDLLREILGLFLDDAPRLVSRMAWALEHSDGPTLKRQAHTMAGVAGNFGLPTVVKAARIIESEASEGPTSRAREAFGVLQEVLASVRSTLLDASRACP